MIGVYAIYKQCGLAKEAIPPDPVNTGAHVSDTLGKLWPLYNSERLETEVKPYLKSISKLNRGVKIRVRSAKLVSLGN